MNLPAFIVVLLAEEPDYDFVQLLPSSISAKAWDVIDYQVTFKINICFIMVYLIKIIRCQSNYLSHNTICRIFTRCCYPHFRYFIILNLQDISMLQHSSQELLFLISGAITKALINNSIFSGRQTVSHNSLLYWMLCPV